MYAADYHVHSTCSPDGKMTMSQAAEAALRASLPYVASSIKRMLLEAKKL